MGRFLDYFGSATFISLNILFKSIDWKLVKSHIGATLVVINITICLCSC